MKLKHAFLPALLCALAACGGGGGASGPKTATALAYTDPTTGTYQLKKNAALSSGSHLVLEVWGPASATGSGVTVAFTLGGTAAAWSNVSASDAAGTYIANGTAFNLGTGTPILKAKLSGATLLGTVAEKGVASPKTLDKALVRIALDLKPGVTAGATATLTPDAAKCQVLNPDGTLSPIAITAATLTAN